MASRITNKINRHALQKICKSVYSVSSESTAFHRSSSNDASAAASTIAINSATISNNNNVSATPNAGLNPPATCASTSPLSHSSIQSTAYHNSTPPLNTTVAPDTDESPSQDLPTGNILSQSASGTAQMPSLSTAYQVCPVRSKTVPNYELMLETQFKSVNPSKASKLEQGPSQMHDLQPAKQPQYYIAEKDVNTPKSNDDALKEAVAKNQSMHGFHEPPASDTNGGYRKFQESMTYRNLTQPFKFSRLANPFPDPVKEMASQKVSDKEKASQMFQDARNNTMAQAHFTQRQKQLRLKPQAALQPNQVRHYSVGKKCPKIPKSKCNKIRTEKSCPPVNKITSCRDSAYIFKKCTKKEAPYPSYSETCHEDRPPGCRSCPWPDLIHPAFKQKKKSYHTAVRSMSSDALAAGTSREVNGCSNDVGNVARLADDGNDSVISMELKKRPGKGKKPACQSHPELDKIPCGYVELDEAEDQMRRNARPKRDGKVVTSKKKAPCKPQISQICPPNTADEKPAGKNKRRPKSKPSKKLAAPAVPSADALYTYNGATTLGGQAQVAHIPDDVAIPVGQSIDDWLAGLHPNKVAMLSKEMSIKSGGPCPKFPFKKQNFTLVINRKPKGNPHYCPKKHKTPLIQDCPKEKCKTDFLPDLLEDVLMFKKHKKGDSKKCPKPKAPACEKVEDKKNDDPCNRKKKPLSEICPNDLLDRKKKNKPTKKGMSTKAAFEDAVAMLDAIERTKSAPSCLKRRI